MGGYLSVRRRTADAEACSAGLVVLPDDTVRSFPGGTFVAELMLEYPQHFVIELRSLVAGAKTSGLPADHRLEPGRVYLVLLMRQGGAATLSSAEARRILLRTRSVLRAGSFPPPTSAAFSSPSSRSNFSTLRCASFIKWRKTRHSVAPGQDEERETPVHTPVFPSEMLTETQVYLSRQLSGSGRGWKPSLPTIEEKTLTKVRHWLLDGAQLDHEKV